MLAVTTLKSTAGQASTPLESIGSTRAYYGAPRRLLGDIEQRHDVDSSASLIFAFERCLWLTVDNMYQAWDGKHDSPSFHQL